MVDLINWPRFFVKAAVSLAINRAILTRRKIAVNISGLFLRQTVMSL